MLNQLTISELTSRIAKREVSAREATQACLDRVAKVDGQIHAFISLTKAIPQGLACTWEVADYLKARLAP